MINGAPRQGMATITAFPISWPVTEWFGASPRLLRDLRGTDAEAVTASSKPRWRPIRFRTSTTRGPVPTATPSLRISGRALPELRSDAAVDRDRQGLSARRRRPFALHAQRQPAVQASVLGLFGVSARRVDEGLEINVLGLVTGIDFVHRAAQSCRASGACRTTTDRPTHRTRRIAARTIDAL